jgi:hypothetical protein
MGRIRTVAEVVAPILTSVRQTDGSTSIHHRFGTLGLSSWAYSTGQNSVQAALHGTGTKVATVDYFPQEGESAHGPFVAVAFSETTQGLKDEPKTVSTVDVFIGMEEAKALHEELGRALAEHHSPRLVPDGVDVRAAGAEGWE